MQRHSRFLPWTEAEDMQVAELWRAGLSYVEIGMAIGLSASAAGHRCLKLGLRRRGVYHSRWPAPKIEAVTITALALQPLHVRLWVRERTRPMPSGLPAVPPAVIDDRGRRLG